MTANIPVNALDRHIAPIASRLELMAAEVIASGYYVLGPNVKAFEREFADWCGVRECVSVANGTDALELGLRSLGVTSGKRVAVVANAAMYGTTAWHAVPSRYSSMSIPRPRTWIPPRWNASFARSGSTW